MSLPSKEKLITPALAAIYLESNTKNRLISDRHVDFLASQIEAGQWKTTGDPIKFAKNGRLLDGQHRLTAIIQANKAVKCYVIDGLEEEVFNVLDTGNKRDAKDGLAIEGVKHSLHVASIIRNVLICEAQGVGKSTLNERGFSRRLRFTIEQIMTYYNKNKTIAGEIERIVAGCTHFNHIGVAIIGTLYHLMLKKDKKFAEHFFDRYFNGDSLNKTSPIFVLRTKLMQDVKGKLNNRDKLILFIMAWNLCKQRKGCTTLSVPKNSNVPDIL